MNKHAHGTDESLVAALKDLYRSEIQRAESDWIAVAASTVALRHSRVGRASRGFALTTLIATLAMVAVLLSRQPGMFPGLGPSQSGGSQSSGSVGPGSPGGGSPKATAGTSVTPRIGPLVDGVPASVDGEPVLRGSEAITRRVGVSTSSQFFLVGGWFHRNSDQKIFCPLYMAGSPWWFCNVFRLYDELKEPSPGGPDKVVSIYTGDPPRLDPKLPAAADRPVVLRIHTHDESCPAMRDCSSLPVLVEVVWLGPTG